MNFESVLSELNNFVLELAEFCLTDVINSIFTPTAELIAQYSSAFEDPSKVHVAYKLDKTLLQCSK